MPKMSSSCWCSCFATSPLKPYTVLASPSLREFIFPSTSWMAWKSLPSLSSSLKPLLCCILPQSAMPCYWVPFKCSFALDPCPNAKNVTNWLLIYHLIRNANATALLLHSCRSMVLVGSPWRTRSYATRRYRSGELPSKCTHCISTHWVQCSRIGSWKFFLT